ncbi:helix-hairpin-helix domain-containing protein [Cyclobacteriaceae bacterium]|nr:helix-hairpin-helix domain-containing protein [Cyclobacteriaceae bacterium]
MFKKWWHSLLGKLVFTPKELKGTVVLVILLGLVLIVPPIKRSLTPLVDQPDLQRQYVLDSLIHELTLQDKLDSTHLIDPNQLTYFDWLDMGASEQVAKQLLYQKKKLGGYSCKQQLLFINGIKESEVGTFFPYFNLPDSCVVKKPKVEFSFDLNRVTKDALIKAGIRKKVAYKYINYRKALGGFCDVDQLKEVYTVNQYELKILRQYGKLVTPVFRKIKINEITFFKLRAHPYINNKLASKIINYRKKIKEYHTFEDLGKVYGMTPATLDKLKPYISF